MIEEEETAVFVIKCTAGISGFGNVQTRVDVAWQPRPGPGSGYREQFRSKSVSRGP